MKGDSALFSCGAGVEVSRPVSPPTASLDRHHAPAQRWDRLEQLVEISTSDTQQSTPWESISG